MPLSFIIVRYLFGKLWIFIKISIFGIFDILIHIQKIKKWKTSTNSKFFWIKENNFFPFMQITDFYELSY